MLGNAGGPGTADDLPGTGSKRKAAIRSRAVTLSPTGQTWAAATTQGVLLYSLDQGLVFDPTDLTQDITPAAANRAVAEKAFLCGMSSWLCHKVRCVKRAWLQPCDHASAYSLMVRLDPDW